MSLAFGGKEGGMGVFCHWLLEIDFLTNWTIFGQFEAEKYYSNLKMLIYVHNTLLLFQLKVTDKFLISKRGQEVKTTHC